MKDHLAQCSEKKNVWWKRGNLFYLKFGVKLTALQWSEIVDFQSIFALSASAVTPSERFN